MTEFHIFKISIRVPIPSIALVVAHAHAPPNKKISTKSREKNRGVSDDQFFSLFLLHKT